MEKHLTIQNSKLSRLYLPTAVHAGHASQPRHFLEPRAYPGALPLESAFPPAGLRPGFDPEEHHKGVPLGRVYKAMRQKPVFLASQQDLFPEPQQDPRYVDAGAGSASQWDPDVEPWRERMGAGEKNPQAADCQQPLTYRAALALAILASIVFLAALGQLVKSLLKNRKQEPQLPLVNVASETDAATSEAKANSEKERKLTQIAMEIEELANKWT
ncbi:uncharacterized protein LOC115337828 isoform X2 [Aquila chrysaetos chrysaetos]|uniref:uncharacterized protein LOC115337828 isoform X2 n=1 Tax=Aquila chrysaetos chrysaetos TaxID=223781 RepID=UPI001176B798|nr:uncharacterized protein LOC115337828 isoform X2 [Aquila chrysaetos chrysaetos]